MSRNSMEAAARLFFFKKRVVVDWPPFFRRNDGFPSVVSQSRIQEVRRRLSTMEVERKFRVSRKNPFVNLENGEYFIQKQEVNFLDEYFDDRSYSLSVHDHWLRRRTLDSNRARWELKYSDHPPERAVARSPCALYSEVSDTQQMASRIGQLLGLDQGVPFEEILNNTLECWCAIRTLRQTYELMIKGYCNPITVVLDSTDYEVVGEVEIVLPENHSSQDIARAERAVNDVFSRFGLENALEGKVERFIREQKPELYERIRHVLMKD